MHLIVDTWVLADPTFEGRADDLADQLDRHPTVAAIIGLARCLWRRARTNLRNDTVQIVVSLWDAHETAYLADTIALAADDGDA